MSLRKEWVVAIIASLAWVFLITTASSCKFLSLSTTLLEEDTHVTSIDDLLSNPASTKKYGGVFCQGQGEWDNTNEATWILSATFLSLALLLGSISTATAWCVVYNSNAALFSGLWFLVSLSSALCAILTVPVFLLFSTEPCFGEDHSSCALAAGAYILLVSLILWITVTIATQLFDPPAREEIEKQDLLSEDRNQPVANELPVDESAVTSEAVVDSPWGRIRNKWLPSLQTRPTRREIEYQQSSDLKVDRTMMEDDDDDIIKARFDNGEEPSDEIEVTEDYVASISMDTHTIPECDTSGGEDGGDDIEGKLKNDPERTGVVRNEAIDTTLSRFSPHNEASLNGGEPLRLISIYASSLLDSENNNDERGKYYTQRDYSCESSIPQYQSNQVYQELDAESSNITIVGVQKLPALADALDDDEDNVSTDEDIHVDVENRNKTIGHDDDDLGSLEPTVLEVTGEESILDRETQSKAVVQEQRRTRAIVQKVIQSPRDLGLAVIYRAKQTTRRRIVKGYKLIDDSDIASSFPWSPPLEILTINISRDSTLDIHPTHLTNEKEQDLLDEWNTIHRNSPSFAHTYSAEPEPEFDSSDEENTSEKLIGLCENNISDEEVMDKSNDDDNESSEGFRRKRRRGRRMHRSRGGRSVASSTSLLSATIEEETAEDLATSDGSEIELHGEIERHCLVPLTRSRSAPALARFGRLKKDAGNVAEDIRMTGIHSYSKVQIFRDTDASTKSSRDRKGVAILNNDLSWTATGPRQRRQMIQSSAHSVPEQRTPSRWVAKRMPLFREERAIRSGMHSQSYFSDHSSSEDTKSATTAPSLRSRQARLARLHRLQGQAQLSPRRAAAIRQKDFHGTPPRNQTRSKNDHVHGSEESAGSEGQENTSFDSGSYMIDLLDVQLAELNRPEGAYIGPDEVSV